MKLHNRMLSILVSLFSISILLAGCSANQATYSSRCLLMSMSNFDADNSSVSSECSYWDGQYFTDKNVDAVASITFDGVQYVGEYQQSIYEKYNSFATHVYLCEPGGVEFGLNSDTNALVYINFKTLDFFETEPYLSELQSPKSETKEIAFKYAMNFIDPNDYTLLSSDPVVRTYLDEETGLEYEMSFYTYDFVKYINGIGTSDYMAVQVTSKGHLASVHLGAIGSFTNSAPLAISENSCDDVIADKITSILSADEVEATQYEIVSEVLTVSPNDELVLVVRATSDIKETTTDDEYSVGIELAVFLE